MPVDSEKPTICCTADNVSLRENEDHVNQDQRPGDCDADCTTDCKIIETDCKLRPSFDDFGTEWQDCEHPGSMWPCCRPLANLCNTRRREDGNDDLNDDAFSTIGSVVSSGSGTVGSLNTLNSLDSLNSLMSLNRTLGGRKKGKKLNEYEGDSETSSASMAKNEETTMDIKVVKADLKEKQLKEFEDDPGTYSAILAKNEESTVDKKVNLESLSGSFPPKSLAAIEPIQLPDFNSDKKSVVHSVVTDASERKAGLPGESTHDKRAKTSTTVMEGMENVADSTVGGTVWVSKSSQPKNAKRTDSSKKKSPEKKNTTAANGRGNVWTNPTSQAGHSINDQKKGTDQTTWHSFGKKKKKQKKQRAPRRSILGDISEEDTGTVGSSSVMTKQSIVQANRDMIMKSLGSSSNLTSTPTERRIREAMQRIEDKQAEEKSSLFALLGKTLSNKSSKASLGPVLLSKSSVKGGSLGPASLSKASIGDASSRQTLTKMDSLNNASLAKDSLGHDSISKSSLSQVSHSKAPLSKTSLGESMSKVSLAQSSLHQAPSKATTSEAMTQASMTQESMTQQASMTQASSSQASWTQASTQALSTVASSVQTPSTHTASLSCSSSPASETMASFSVVDSSDATEVTRESQAGPIENQVMQSTLPTIWSSEGRLGVELAKADDVEDSNVLSGKKANGVDKEINVGNLPDAEDASVTKYSENSNSFQKCLAILLNCEGICGGATTGKVEYASPDNSNTVNNVHVGESSPYVRLPTDDNLTKKNVGNVFETEVNNNGSTIGGHSSQPGTTLSPSTLTASTHTASIAASSSSDSAPLNKYTMPSNEDANETSNASPQTGNLEKSLVSSSNPDATTREIPTKNSEDGSGADGVASICLSVAAPKSNDDGSGRGTNESTRVGISLDDEKRLKNKMSKETEPNTDEDSWMGSILKVISPTMSGIKSNGITKNASFEQKHSDVEGDDRKLDVAPKDTSDVMTSINPNDTTGLGTSEGQGEPINTNTSQSRISDSASKLTALLPTCQNDLASNILEGNKCACISTRSGNKKLDVRGVVTGDESLDSHNKQTDQVNETQNASAKDNSEVGTNESVKKPQKNIMKKYWKLRRKKNANVIAPSAPISNTEATTSIGSTNETSQNANNELDREANQSDTKEQPNSVDSSYHQTHETRRWSCLKEQTEEPEGEGEGANNVIKIGMVGIGNSSDKSTEMTSSKKSELMKSTVSVGSAKHTVEQQGQDEKYSNEVSRKPSATSSSKAREKQVSRDTGDQSSRNGVDDVVTSFKDDGSNITTTARQTKTSQNAENTLASKQGSESGASGPDEPNALSKMQKKSSTPVAGKDPSLGVATLGNQTVGSSQVVEAVESDDTPVAATKPIVHQAEKDIEKASPKKPWWRKKGTKSKEPESTRGIGIASSSRSCETVKKNTSEISRKSLSEVASRSDSKILSHKSTVSHFEDAAPDKISSASTDSINAENKDKQEGVALSIKDSGGKLASALMKSRTSQISAADSKAKSLPQVLNWPKRSQKAKNKSTGSDTRSNPSLVTSDKAKEFNNSERLSGQVMKSAKGEKSRSYSIASKTNSKTSTVQKRSSASLTSSASRESSEMARNSKHGDSSSLSTTDVESMSRSLYSISVQSNAASRTSKASGRQLPPALVPLPGESMDEFLRRSAAVWEEHHRTSQKKKEKKSIVSPSHRRRETRALAGSIPFGEAESRDDVDDDESRFGVVNDHSLVCGSVQNLDNAQAATQQRHPVQRQKLLLQSFKSKSMRDSTTQSHNHKNKNTSHNTILSTPPPQNTEVVEVDPRDYRSEA